MKNNKYIDIINNDYSLIIERLFDIYKNDMDLFRIFESMQRNQFLSKKQIVDELRKSEKVYKDIIILGGWYGTWLPILLRQLYPKANITSVDIDKSLKSITKHFHKNLNLNIKFKYCDATELIRSKDILAYDLVINPSCEHMPDMNNFINYTTDYILQSNNHYMCEEHTNCKDNLADFLESTGLTTIYSSSIIKLNKFDRFMIYGTK